MTLNHKTTYLLLLSFVLLTGFSLPSFSQTFEELRKENQMLRRQLQDLKDEIGALRHSTSIMKTEKFSRVKESSSLRGEVRTFVQNNIDDLKSFLLVGDLLDYIGSEQKARSNHESGRQLIVDFGHPVDNSGILTGVGGYFNQAGAFHVKLFRPVGTEYVTIWESREFKAPGSGKHFFQFPVSVGIQRGDVVGYFFPDSINVSFDSNVSGQVQVKDSDALLGSVIKKSGNIKQRAYSLGAYGLFDFTAESDAMSAEAARIRNKVRDFVQNNIDNLKSFIINSKLQDYFGSERIPRSQKEKGNLFLVDFGNPALKSGVMTGVSGFFYQPGAIQVKLLRPIGGQYVVIWESDQFNVSRAGRKTFQFPVSVGIQEDDVIGYYFPNGINVGFDYSSGDTLHTDKTISLGGLVTKRYLDAEDEKRSYSVGVYGLLN